VSHARGTALLGRVMLAFVGERLPDAVAKRLGSAPAAGVTLFRHHNIRSPGQVRELADAIQSAVSRGGSGSRGESASHERRPLLIAADQEGGQFIALGDGSTPFAGNMALGAVDDEALTERVGRAIGTEARAMGINVVYSPVLDIASNPANPALGIRSFGADPLLVARHGVALVRGLQSAGVAATVKHAPGAGEATTDPHHGGAVITASRAILDTREFIPFRAAFAAGARLAMSAHVALPAVTGREDVPSTLSRAVMTGLLRRELGFEGVTISDALDMGAVAEPDRVADVVAAIRAGVDLLLTAADPEALVRMEAALVEGAEAGMLDADELVATERRVGTLRAWLGSAGATPDLGVVAGAEHRALAAELATRSITLVRDPGGLMPVADGDHPRRVLAVMPRPTDLTPADTSSTVAPGLAAALRRYHADVDEVVVDPEPDDAAIAAVRDRARGADLAVVGTIDAHRLRSQLALLDAIARTGTPTIAAALRGPWDIDAYPAWVTALATYSILPGSLEALAAVLAGQAAPPGRSPVALASAVPAA
jgi:beta-N-acetylhexosaminidase